MKLGAEALCPCLCWDKNGKDFYALEKNGTLHRIALDRLMEHRLVDLDNKCSWLALSANGLLVTLTDLQEVWVIDPDTFKVKTRIAVPSGARTVSVPGLAVAFAVGQGDMLHVLDLNKGTLVKQYSGRDFPNTGFQLPTVTPDGKYLFTLGGIEQLHRFRIKDTEIVFEESSQRIAQGRLEDIQVSPDSRYVCLPCGGGNYGDLKDHPKVNPYSTYIYPATNLNKPAFTLEQGAYPLAVGFDPKAGLIYTQNFSFNLIVFTYNGLMQKEYKVGSGRDVRQYLVCPEGRKLLLLSEARLWLVELAIK